MRYRFPRSFDHLDQADEIEERLRSMALSIGRHHSIDADELYQEGVLGIIQRRKPSAHVGQMVLYARWAMKAFAQREVKQRCIKSDVAKARWVVRDTARTFDQLDECLGKLEPSERRIMEMWLEGKTLTEIMREVGLWQTNRVKKTIEQCAGKMAESMGQDVHVECLWPALTGSLPLGVSWVYGRFVARACANNKKNYVGTFGTVDEAVAARQAWIESNKPASRRKATVV